MKIRSGSHIYIFLFQGGFFMSMFFALRGMATAPVPSMTSGGLYWFTGKTAFIASYSALSLWHTYFNLFCIVSWLTF
jgi:hypothetical protein